VRNYSVSSNKRLRNFENQIQRYGEPVVTNKTNEKEVLNETSNENRMTAVKFAISKNVGLTLQRVLFTHRVLLTRSTAIRFLSVLQTDGLEIGLYNVCSILQER
jgi:hypothetical protein